jgi:hypothetical protein
MKRNILIVSVFLLGTTLGFAQTETGKTNSKEKTLKVKEANEVQLKENKHLSKSKINGKAVKSNSDLTEQELIEKRKNLGVIDPKPGEVLTREK